MLDLGKDHGSKKVPGTNELESEVKECKLKSK